MIRKITQGFAHIKNLKTTAISTEKGLKVTYPNLQNTVHEIQNPMQTFISSLAACELATLRAVVKSNKNAKLQKVTFIKIESNYDLGHWAKGGGKQNKINEIHIEAEVETNLTAKEFDSVKQKVELLCPIYQMISSAGVKVISTWRLKQIA